MVVQDGSTLTDKVMYSFRGLIAFIAFMDIGLAIRSFVEKRTILSVSSSSVFNEPTVMRILGAYSLLKAITLIHCTLYIYHKPVVSISICCCLLTMLMYLMEAIVFHSTALNFYIIYSCVLNGVTIIGLIVLPDKCSRKFAGGSYDENKELLRQMQKNKKFIFSRLNKVH